jgi:hypothetical protein
MFVSNKRSAAPSVASREQVADAGPIIVKTLGHRVGYTVREAAALLGRRTEALRREIERHSRFEGGQIVARLAGGVTAYRRKDGGRWLVIFPAALTA